MDIRGGSDRKNIVLSRNKYGVQLIKLTWNCLICSIDMQFWTVRSRSSCASEANQNSSLVLEKTVVRCKFHNAFPQYAGKFMSPSM